MKHELERGMHWVAIGAFVLAIAVMLGAFGAHGLKDLLTVERMATYQTAVQYQFYHGLGIILVGVVLMNFPNSDGVLWSAMLLLTGLFLFSGSLYLLTLFGLRWLGMVTPLGGIAFIAGWIVLAVTLLRLKNNAP